MRTELWEAFVASTDAGHVDPQSQRVIRRVGPSPSFAGQYTYDWSAWGWVPTGKRVGTGMAPTDQTSTELALALGVFARNARAAAQATRFCRRRAE